MAASIITAPTGIKSALEFVTYVANLSDLGTAPEERRFGYKLINMTDALDVTEYRYVRPHSAILNFPLSFEDDLHGLVFTTPPPLGSTAVVIDVNIWKEIVLEYSERVINSEDCTVVDNVIGTTDPFIVLNSNPQIWDTVLPSAEPIVLHRIPSVVFDCRDTERFVWVYGEVPVTMRWRMNGTLLGQATVTTQAGDVSIVPIGFNVMGVPAGTNRIDISFGPTDPPHPPFSIRLDTCCCDDRCTKDIYFQNRWGGFDVFTTSCLSGRQLLHSHQEWCLSSDYALTPAERAIAGEIQSVSKNSNSILLFQKDIDYESNDARHIEDLFHSRNHYIKDYDINGNAYLAKFILSDGQAVTYQEQDQVTITFSGKYSNRVKMPY